MVATGVQVKLGFIKQVSLKAETFRIVISFAEAWNIKNYREHFTRLRINQTLAINSQSRKYSRVTIGNKCHMFRNK